MPQFKEGDRVVVFGLGVEVEGVHCRYYDGDVGAFIGYEGTKSARVNFDIPDNEGARSFFRVNLSEIRLLYQSQSELMFEKEAS
jgi:hypothetical protein